MKKGQAALEYLMTYGWAILIIIVVVAALYAMGVFTVSPGVPCSPCFSYFAYVDHSGTSLVVINGARETSSINATADGSALTPSATSASPGDTITFTGTIADGASVVITYTVTASGIVHTDSATLHAV